MAGGPPGRHKRSAAPTLDPATTHQVPGVCEEDAEGPGHLPQVAPAGPPEMFYAMAPMAELTLADDWHAFCRISDRQQYDHGEGRIYPR